MESGRTMAIPLDCSVSVGGPFQRKGGNAGDKPGKEQGGLRKTNEKH